MTRDVGSSSIAATQNSDETPKGVSPYEPKYYKMRSRSGAFQTDSTFDRLKKLLQIFLKPKLPLEFFQKSNKPLVLPKQLGRDLA